jgi:hypothetical protein
MGDDLLINCLTLYGCLCGILPWSIGDLHLDNFVTSSCSMHMEVSSLLRRTT